jgi:hypothetical protein
VATFDDVRRIALELPEAVIDDDGTAFRVDGKLFAWPWLERVDARKARVPNLGVLVVRIASEADKEVLIEMDPRVFFTEPHYDGYAAIQVRLDAIDDPLLEKVITDSWRLRAPKRLHDWSRDHT